MQAADERTPPARILVVCTGNICRSPYGERVLRQLLPPDRVEVSSAGVYAMVGDPIDAESARLLSARGAQINQFHARQLTESMVAQSDLVLAMGLEHRAEVCATLPRAVRRTFTVLEAARYLPYSQLPDDEDPAQRVRALPAALARGRALAPLGEDAVPDPYRRGSAAFEQMAAVLDPALEAIARAITG